jgi:hypothetical protein
MTKLPDYLKILLEYFVDETPFNHLQMQTLIDNGLVEEQKGPSTYQDMKCYVLTEKGKLYV